ncbi:MAG: transposase [Proteobacteria bacterium]|nr:transposase [Pseudomonadota bacterium]
MSEKEVSVKRTRRRHSEEFRAEAVAACKQPGVSLASVALGRRLNANLLRRWVVEAGGAKMPVRKQLRPAFVPVRVEPPPAVKSEPPIRIELRKGTTQVLVEWPTAHAAACVRWLKELLR